MTKKGILCILVPVLAFGITIGLIGVAYASANSNIDPDNKYAWSTNAGWISFYPTHGGVMVYADHLEGYAWGENVGWICLGTHTGGGAHTYGNTSAADYGVNRDISTGELSGFAWGTNVGWISFSPAFGWVSLDLVTGKLSGFAWGENIGWIHLSNAGPPAYGVSIVIHRTSLPLALRDY